MPKNEENKKVEKEEKKGIDEEKKDLAKAFGLSLADVEHFKLDNGHEFFKFKDPKTQTYKIIEHIDYNSSMNDSFKNAQNDLSSAQTNDSLGNAKNIYEYNVKHKNTELKLVTITDIKNDEFRYRKIFRDDISTIVYKKILLLLKHSIELKIRYINLDYGFGINKDGVVIDVSVDLVKGKANFKSAEVVKYDDKEITVDENNIVVELSDEDLDMICEEITITDDTPVVENAKEIEVKGEKISTKAVVDAYNNPELVDTIQDTKQRSLYRAIVEHLAKRMAKKRNKAKQYVLKNNNDNNRAA